MAVFGVSKSQNFIAFSCHSSKLASSIIPFEQEEFIAQSSME
jgi:hypothetical protein